MSAACCTGFLDDGVPTGFVEEFAGTLTYVAEPQESNTQHNESQIAAKGAILIATDAFGYTLVNNRLLADAFAKDTGMLCIVPDLFGAKGGIPPDLLIPLEKSRTPKPWWKQVLEMPYKVFAIVRIIITFVLWIRHQAPALKVPLLESVMVAVQEKYGVSKFGVQGYCYGGKLAVLLGGKSDGLVTAVAMAHPSFLKEEDVEQLCLPQLWLCAETDRAFGEKLRTKVEEICKRKESAGGPPASFHLYPGVEHGFAVRGNAEDPVVRKAREDAFSKASNFFKTYLAK